MTKTQLIDLGVSADKIEVIKSVMAPNKKILFTEKFTESMIGEINNSDGVYFEETKDPPEIGGNQILFIRYVLK